MSTIFDYSVSPAIVSYSSSSDSSIVELQLSVLNNNNTSNDVPCTAIVFVLPVGDGPGDLVTTDNVGSIACSAATGTLWSITGKGDGTFTAKPNSGSTGLDAEESIAFLLSNVTVNDFAGLAAITVWEGTQAPPVEGSIDITKTTPGLAITSFTATPVEADVGSTVTLTWTTVEATTVTLSYPGSSVTVASNGSASPTIQQTTTYVLTASDAGGTTVTAEITVTVPAVQIVSFTSSATQIAAGTAVTLSWDIVNFASATITYEPDGLITCSGAQGSTSVTPSSPTTYILNALGISGSTAAEPVTVEVMPVSIVSFSGASSTSVPPSTDSTLVWQTAFANGVTLNGTAVGVSSSLQVSPVVTTTYTLVANGYDGPAQQTQTVTIDPVQVLFGSTNIGEGAGAIEWLIGDVDGDGSDEVVQLWADGGQLGMIIYDWSNNAMGVSWSTSNIGEGAGAIAFLIGDVNGDGSDEIVQLWASAGQLGVIVYGWSASSAEMTVLWSTTDTGQGDAAIAFLIGDVNGDGTDEVVQLWDSAGQLGMIVYGWSNNAMTTLWGTTNTGQGAGAFQWLIGDVNNDGSDEVVQLWDDGGQLGLIVYGWMNGAMTTIFGNPDMGQGSGAMAWLIGNVTGNGYDAIVQEWDNAGMVGTIVYGYP